MIFYHSLNNYNSFSRVYDCFGKLIYRHDPLTHNNNNKSQNTQNNNQKRNTQNNNGSTIISELSNQYLNNNRTKNMGIHKNIIKNEHKQIINEPYIQYQNKKYKNYSIIESLSKN